MTVGIVLRLDPEQLDNPDLDLRYRLPDTIAARSGGTIRPDGYDYEQAPGNAMLLFLLANSEADLPFVVDVLQTQRLLENDLSDVTVAVAETGNWRVVHPPRLFGSAIVIPAGG